MASVSGASGHDLVERLIAQNGQYPGDPPVRYIVAYQTIEGEPCWALCYMASDLNNALDSPYVVNPQIIFTRKGT